MKKEIWKDIVGKEGEYKVSNLGNVKSLERMVKGKIGTRLCHERILKKIKGKRGYYVVGLDRKSSPKTIHRLVAIAFIPNPENKPCVNHIDGNKLNNDVSNLEWCTYSENNIHGLRTGLIIPPWKNKFGKMHHRSKPVKQYSMDGRYIKTFYSIMEATRMVGLRSSSLITACASHKPSQLTAAGFKWEYA